MAQVSELKKLSREQLNDFAKEHGITEPEKAKNIDELAEQVSPVVTPEQLAEYRVKVGLDQPAGAENADGGEEGNEGGDETPPVEEPTGEDGDGDGDEPADTEEPQGDDETDDEGDDEPTPADDAFGGENGQRSEDEEPEEGEPTVKLKNPGGRVVEVPASHVAHHKMFAAGFTLVKGEKYPEDVKALDEAYRGSIHARNIYNDVDDSDPQQSMSKGDVERRKGTKKVGESDGEPQARVAAPKNANKPATFDGVDKRENGQVVDPKTNKPLKGNRLAQALKG